jgi:hypothetical protein
MAVQEESFPAEEADFTTPCFSAGTAAPSSMLLIDGVLSLAAEDPPDEVALLPPPPHPVISDIKDTAIINIKLFFILNSL